MEQLLRLDLGAELKEADLKVVREFVMKFQQLSGPAMAKGLEDTAFYRFNQLISLNEVRWGSGKFGVDLENFTRQIVRLRRSIGRTRSLASATHDTNTAKIYARLNVLSEMPDGARWSGVGRN